MNKIVSFYFKHASEKSFDFGYDTVVGIKHADITSLNQVLKNEGLPTSDANQLFLGGGMNFNYGNHLSHFTGNGAFNEEGNGINYGYKIELSIFNLVPEVGITREAMVIEIEELPNQNTGIRTQINNASISKLNIEAMAASIGLRILFHNDFGAMFPGFFSVIRSR